jgi:integrase
MDNPKDKVIQKLGHTESSIHPISYINLVNKHMKKVLGDRFTSHSFRQGLLTEMGAKSVNPKIIQHFIGHKSIKTTLNYITPTKDDIQNALVR